MMFSVLNLTFKTQLPETNEDWSLLKRQQKNKSSTLNVHLRDLHHLLFILFHFFTILWTVFFWYHWLYGCTLFILLLAWRKYQAFTKDTSSAWNISVIVLNYDAVADEKTGNRFKWWIHFVKFKKFCFKV